MPSLAVYSAMGSIHSGVRNSIVSLGLDFAAEERRAEFLSNSGLSAERDRAIEARDAAERAARIAGDKRDAAYRVALAALAEYEACERAAIPAEYAAGVASDVCCVLAAESNRRRAAILAQLADLGPIAA